MTETRILDRNLLALSSRDPELSARLSSEPSDKSIRFIRAKSSHTVPSLLREGRLITLHSRFDPVKEGLRYLDAARGAGYLVFLGLGAGYHIEPFLKSGDVANILVIEKGMGMVRSVLEEIDMRALLMDPRVKILIDADFADIKRTILSDYRPALAGNLKTIDLKARVAVEQSYFEGVVDALRSVINRVADDYTVQSQFGKKWFVNTLANLSKAENSSQTLRPVRRILITGAGPSLERQIDKLVQMKTDGFLVASDTSLPFLLAHEIMPDLVVSIDCQQVSYHHFLSGYPAHVPLMLDLASPHVLTSFTDKLIFFSSGHPFSQYLTSHWRRLPVIDTSGGNVSHAALSLAGLLRPDEIYLFGVDFSFPEGKSYARGTYIYPLFRSQEQRTLPLETSFFSFLRRNERMIRDRQPDYV